MAQDYIKEHIVWENDFLLQNDGDARVTVRFLVHDGNTNRPKSGVMIGAECWAKDITGFPLPSRPDGIVEGVIIFDPLEDQTLELVAYLVSDPTNTRYQKVIKVSPRIIQAAKKRLEKQSKEEPKMAKEKELGKRLPGEPEELRIIPEGMVESAESVRATSTLRLIDKGQKECKGLVKIVANHNLPFSLVYTKNDGTPSSDEPASMHYVEFVGKSITCEIINTNSDWLILDAMVEGWDLTVNDRPRIPPPRTPNWTTVPGRKVVASMIPFLLAVILSIVALYHPGPMVFSDLEASLTQNSQVQSWNNRKSAVIYVPPTSDGATKPAAVAQPAAPTKPSAGRLLNWYIWWGALAIWVFALLLPLWLFRASLNEMHMQLLRRAYATGSGSAKTGQILERIGKFMRDQFSETEPASASTSAGASSSGSKGVANSILRFITVDLGMDVVVGALRKMFRRV